MSTDYARMRELTQDLPSKSAKMRALARAGYSRSDIARFLGTRYQFVRNVLVHEETKKAPPRPGEDRAKLDVAAETAKWPRRVRLQPNGELLLSREFGEGLGLKPGGVVFAHLNDGEIHLLSPRAAMERARAIVRQFVPEGVSLVDELIAERRREAEREFSDG